MPTWLRRALAAVGASLLLGCASTDKPVPAPLEAYTPRVTLAVAWQHKLGGSPAGLQALVREGRLAVATREGALVTLDLASGAERERVTVGSRLAAGLGRDGRHSAVVTDGNELVAVEAGRALWRNRLPARVVTAPLVAGERVFVQTVDRGLMAFDVLDGRVLWTLTRPGEALALAQPGVLMTVGDNLLASAGPRLLVLDPLQGTVRREWTLANPRGTNEVERLADLVGPASRVGASVCARAFQSGVGCVDVEQGYLAWTRPQAGFQGVAGDAQRVFGADGNDRLGAWQRASGDIAWSHERLRNRGLTAPVVVDPGVAVGDASGWVHLLARDKGDTLARVATDGSAVVALVPAGGLLIALTQAGGVHAWRLP